MTYHEPTLHIHAPAPIKVENRFFHCRKYKRRRKHRMEHFERYDPWAKCLKCGTRIQWEWGAS